MVVKERVAQGTDPIAYRKEAKFQIAADRMTFAMLTREWIEARRPDWSPRYVRLIEGRLKSDILPIIGDKPVRSILPRTMLKALRLIDARGSYEMAHSIKNHCSEIFRFGIPDGRCESAPCRDLSAAMIKPAPVRHRAKVEIKDLPEFFARLNSSSRAASRTS